MLELNMLESIIFSRLKAQFSQKIKAKYKDLTFTTQEESKVKPKFPNVYFCLVPEDEAGETLEGSTYAGGYFLAQIRVTNNTGQTAVQEITTEIMRIMKKMRFRFKGSSGYQNDADTQWNVIRFRRLICNGDIL